MRIFFRNVCCFWKVIISLVGVVGSKWNLIRPELIAMSRIVERAKQEAILLLAR